MHVALLANTAWLDEELSAFQNLMVGLFDEQVRVAQVVPQHLPDDEASLFAERITWQESRFRLLNHHRIGRLSNELESLGVNLVHALDGRTWKGATVLGNSIQSAVVFGACSCLDLKLVEGIARTMNPDRIAFAATTQVIGQAIRQQLDPGIMVQTIVPGIHPVQEPPPAAREGPFCAVVSGHGTLDENYRTLLEGMAEVCRRQPEAQFFFDSQGGDQHQIWKLASQLGLLPNMSFVPRRLGHREVLLRADVLIHPQALGRSRSITLQAMARGLPIVAHHDPWLDYLLDGQTAWVLERTTADQWVDRLSQLMTDPKAGRELGRRAQGWVRQNRRTSDQIASVLSLYQRLTGATIEFPGPAS